MKQKIQVKSLLFGAGITIAILLLVGVALATMYPGTIDMGGTGKIVNLAPPTASADAATKGYVDAAGGPSYIVTTRGQDCWYGYFPPGWTIQSSWTYSVNAGNCYRETLCAKT